MIPTASKLSENINARKAAEAFAKLADEEAEIHGARFWWNLQELLIEKFPTPQRELAGQARPMTDAEAKSFGAEKIPFGKFSGRRIDDVPLSYLHWYADQSFQDDLRKYLDSERVKGERDV